MSAKRRTTILIHSKESLERILFKPFGSMPEPPSSVQNALPSEERSLPRCSVPAFDSREEKTN
jgi:hypothetical protein